MKMIIALIFDESLANRVGRKKKEHYLESLSVPKTRRRINDFKSLPSAETQRRNEFESLMQKENNQTHD